MKVKVQIEVEVDQTWIDFCVKHNDLFMHSYIGYWARGVERTNKRGWLVWEFENDPRYADMPRDDFYTDKPHKEALAAWRADAPLPQHYYRLDEAAAIKAWQKGVERWGVDWYDRADANYYDELIQFALLGELRYG